MAVRWQMNFKTMADESAVVYVYDKEWSGAVTMLQPAAEPFVTAEDSGADFLTPVRAQSGYMRVVDDGSLVELMPKNNTAHMVELVVGSEVKWVGYMQAAEYSSDWDVEPVVEYPLTSAIGVLTGVYMDDEKPMGMVTLGALLEECLTATGVDWYGVYLPNEVGAGEWLQPLEMKVSRFNFFAAADSDDEDAPRYDAQTCAEVLEAICALWGWTMQERGKAIWLSSANVTAYTFISIYDLHRFAQGETITPSEVVTGAVVPIEEIVPASTGHKRDVVQGRKKVRVRAMINAVGDVVPEVDLDGREEKYNDEIDYEGLTLPDTGSDLYEQLKIYSRKKRIDGKWEDATYTRNYNTGEWSLYNPDADGYVPASNGAQVVEYDRYTFEESKSKRNYNYTQAVRLAIKANNKIGEQPTQAQAMEMPVLQLLSDAVANYESGAFVIEGTASGIEKGYFDADKIANVPSKVTNGKCVLPVMFRVGGMYWNGSGWQTSKAVFDVRVGAQEDANTTAGNGVVVSTKTLQMPYNGADGYVMPIDGRMTGDVELVVYAPYQQTTTDVVYLNNFGVQYYKDDKVVTKDKESNNYSETIGGYEEEKEVKLAMASNNNNAAGYGILVHDTIDASAMAFAVDGVTRPELALLGNLIRHYGGITERLTIEAERTNIMPCDRVAYDGKAWRVMSVENDWAEERERIVIYEIKG